MDGISCAVLDETVDIHLVRMYFTAGAWKALSAMKTAKMDNYYGYVGCATTTWEMIQAWCVKHALRGTICAAVALSSVLREKIGCAACVIQQLTCDTEQTLREPPQYASTLLTLTSDFLTMQVVFESRVTWVNSVPISVFLGLSVLDLGQMYVTDRRQTA